PTPSLCSKPTPSLCSKPVCHPERSAQRVAEGSSQRLPLIDFVTSSPVTRPLLHYFPNHTQCPSVAHNTALTSHSSNCH
ncbi:MAG: hypothetical protein FWE96_05050, partial [Coriobacteriia bacterium]|nr:hypothetical protein [Coriobacteriia bacterium]